MKKFMVTPSPHILSTTTTTTIMLDVIIALMPALIASSLIFGMRAILVILVCTVSCVGFEWLTRIVMRRKNTISDFSAVVTGVLLAYNLPATIPLWICVIGSFFAIVIVKQLFGGIGQNFANPAITARVILMISFTAHMTTWIEPFVPFDVDIITQATPLADLSAVSYMDLFLGTVSGSLGETSALALLIGGAYLVIRRIITPVIPLTYIGGVFVLAWAFGENPVSHILSGGLMLGAIFMATDYSTSPMTKKGQVVFALGCALITMLIRQFGSYPEGVSFAILFMNILTPLIDTYIRTKPFSAVGRSK